MTTEATVLQKSLCGSNNGYYFVDYELSNVGTSSSILFRLPLVSKGNQDQYINPHNSGLEDTSYGIVLDQYTVSCLSTDFDFKILNVNDETKEGTFNEIYQSLNIGSRESGKFVNLLFLNRDDPMDNALYVLLNNNDADNETGTIKVQLVYRSIKTKADESYI